MTILRLARPWASNPSYIGGASVGVTTKTDPGSAMAANGIYENLPFAAQHLNHQLNTMSLTDRVAFMRFALTLREVRVEGGTITDTAESLAAISIDPSQATLVIKANPSFWVTDWSRPEIIGAVNGIDANVRDAATDGAGNIIAIGTYSAGLGYGISKSNDNGGSWSLGKDGTLARHRVVYSQNSASTGFVISLTGTGSQSVERTADGDIPVSTSNTGLAADGGGGGIAVLNAGASDILVVCGELAGGAGRPAFRRSNDGALTWVAGAQAVPGACEDIGCLVGNGGSVAYHVATALGGGSLIVSAITAGGVSLAMTTVTTITPPTGATFSTSTDARILMCQNTGLLVIVAPLSNGFTALFASLDAVDWVGPTLMGTTFLVHGFALAGGRLFATRNDMLFASDGIGTV